jgi:hypothetical protein
MRMECGVARTKTDVIFVSGIKREKGFDSFVDDDGDLEREPE